MSVAGVWKVEVKGPYGWEKIGTAFLQNGRYLAASVDHYSIGSYEAEGDAFTADIQVNQYGKVRAAYGSKKRQMSHRVTAKMKKEDKILGHANPSSGKKFDVKIRLTRLGDLEESTSAPDTSTTAQ